MPNNKLETLTVTATPTDLSTNWKTSADTDAIVTVTASGDDIVVASNGTITIPMTAFTSSNKLYPSTKYDIVATGEDSYGNTIQNPGHIQFDTEHDYPMFNNFTVTHLDSNAFTFNNVCTGDYTVTNDASTVTISNDITDDARVTLLNNDLLTTNRFSGKNIIDYHDKNTFIPEAVQGGTYEPVSNLSSQAPDLLPYYTPYINVFNYYNPTLFSFGTYNAKVGIFNFPSASSTVVKDNGSSTNYTLIDSTYTGTVQSDTQTVMTQRPIPAYTGESLSIGSIDYDSSHTSTLSTFITTITDSPSSDMFKFLTYYPSGQEIAYPFIGMNLKGQDSGNDAKVTITINANANKKISSDVASYITLDSYIIAPPKITLKQVNGSGTEVEGSVSPYYDEIVFGNDYSLISGSSTMFNINFSTNALHPFLGLHNDILATNSSYQAFGINSNYVNTSFASHIDSRYRLTPTLVLGAFNGISDTVLVGNQTEPTYIIGGGCPVVGTTPQYFIPYANSSANVSFTDADNGFVNRASEIGASAHGSDNKFDKSVSVWPDSSCGLVRFSNLIPGTTYRFKAMAANFTGTTIETFDITTKAAEDIYYTSSSSPLYENGTNDGNNINRTITISDEDSVTLSYTVYNYGGWNITAAPSIKYSGEEISTQSSYTGFTVQSTEFNNTSGNATIRFTTPGTYEFTIPGATVKLLNSTAANEVTHTYEDDGVFSYKYTITVTQDATMSVATGEPQNVTTDSAELTGSLTTTGTVNVVAGGYLYCSGESTDDAPTALAALENDSTVTTESGAPQSTGSTRVDNGTTITSPNEITGLTPNTHYWYRAWAITSEFGLKFGVVEDFTTDTELSLTLAVNDVQRTNAGFTLTLS